MFKENAIESEINSTGGIPEILWAKSLVLKLMCSGMMSLSPKLPRRGFAHLDS